MSKEDIMKLLRIHTWWLATVMALPTAALIGPTSDVWAGDDDDDDDAICAPTPPEEYDPFVVFVANGEFPDTEPQGLFGDLTAFTDINGWDQDQIDTWREDKLDLLGATIGVADPLSHPDLQVLMGTTNPVIDYHVVTFTGRQVPPEGWAVREGFLVVVVTNPAGFTLGGQFAGEHVPVGTIVGGGGLYNIEVTDDEGNVTGEEIVFDFTTVQPVEPVTGGRAAFFCDIDSDDFGAGLAQGVNALVPIGGGMLKANVRNVITFSDAGGL